ncbi:MAG: Na/Pi cotransporter family protein [Bdellovibrionaceae bacterium]|nr:Na/Pi cotransporter family protein [Pseudobdellovibrionaceae bacterium]
MLAHTAFIYTLAGLAFFLYGLKTISQNLQKISGDLIQRLLSKMSNKPIYGVFFGILLAFSIQSSAAVVSMLVSLGSSSVLTLFQVMGIILGSAIGSTFIVQILSFKISNFGLALFSVFYLFSYFFIKTKKMKRFFRICFGFGLMFFGLELISLGSTHLKDAELFIKFLHFFIDSPILTLLIAAAFTAVVQSSVVTIGIAISLMSAGYFSLEHCIYWVYGANIGTTATAILSAVSGNYIGKRVAWAHFLFKTISVGLFFFLTPFILPLIADSFSNIRGVAHFHTLFNTISVIIFYPFINYAVAIIEYLIPKPKSIGKFGVKYFSFKDIKNLSTAVAFTQAKREILRMGDIMGSMLSRSLFLFDTGEKKAFFKIKEGDNNVDLLCAEINRFLLALIERSSKDSEEAGEADIEKINILQAISFSSDVESAADSVDKNLVKLAVKKQKLHIQFSELDQKNLVKLQNAVADIVVLSMTYFDSKELSILKELKKRKEAIRQAEYTFRVEHINNCRKEEGEKLNINLTNIYLDILSEYRHIAELMINPLYYIKHEIES